MKVLDADFEIPDDNDGSYYDQVLSKNLESLTVGELDPIYANWFPNLKVLRLTNVLHSMKINQEQLETIEKLPLTEIHLTAMDFQSLKLIDQHLPATIKTRKYGVEEWDDPKDLQNLDKYPKVSKLTVRVYEPEDEPKTSMNAERILRKMDIEELAVRGSPDFVNTILEKTPMSVIKLAFNIKSMT